MKNVFYFVVMFLGFTAVSCDKNKEHYTTVAIVTDSNLIVVDSIVYENLKTDVKQTSTSVLTTTSNCEYRVSTFKLNEDYLSGQKYKVSVYYNHSASDLSYPKKFKLMYLKDGENMCDRVDQGSWLSFSEYMQINESPMVFEN